MFSLGRAGFLYLCLLDIIHRDDLAVPYGRIADAVFRAGADRFSDLMVRLAGVDRYAVRSGRIIACDAVIIRVGIERKRVVLYSAVRSMACAPSMDTYIVLPS